MCRHDSPRAGISLRTDAALVLGRDSRSDPSPALQVCQWRGIVTPDALPGAVSDVCQTSHPFVGSRLKSPVVKSLTPVPRCYERHAAFALERRESTARF